MAKYIILGIVILNLAMFTPCAAQVAIPSGGSASSTPASGPGSSAQMSVQDIVVDKIDGGAIYSKDGSSFDMTGAKVIDNSHNAPGNKTAALFFQDGQLVQVILK